jgi:hypothetical protein
MSRGSAGAHQRIGDKPSTWMPEGTDLQTLRRESRAWNCRINRDQIKINGKFDRRSARRKFGHKGKYFKRSEN